MANTTADKSGQPRDGTVGALLHGLAVLDMFSWDRPVVGIAEVSRQLGVHRSTASRLAATLAAAGYLEPAGEQGRYRLAAKLSLLGELAAAGDDYAAGCTNYHREVNYYVKRNQWLVVDNIPRVLPHNCDVVIRKGFWDMLPIFKMIEAKSGVPDEELYQVFNMGIGMVTIVAA